MIISMLTKLYTSVLNMKYKIQGVKTRLIPIGPFQYVIKGKVNDSLLEEVKKRFLLQEHTS
jgi:hypothetical protein